MLNRMAVCGKVLRRIIELGERQGLVLLKVIENHTKYSVSINSRYRLSRIIGLMHVFFFNSFLLHTSARLVEAQTRYMINVIFGLAHTALVTSFSVHSRRLSSYTACAFYITCRRYEALVNLWFWKQILFLF